MRHKKDGGLCNREQQDCIGRGDDADVRVTAEREKVAVAGDDEFGTGRDGRRDNLIVRGIARDDSLHGRRRCSHRQTGIERYRLIDQCVLAFEAAGKMFAG